MATHYGRTLTLFWDDRHVVGRWCDGVELEPVRAAEPTDRVQWLVELIRSYQRTYPGARVRATNRPRWREPERGAFRFAAPAPAPADGPAYVVHAAEALAPLHFHVLPGRRVAKECWHLCAR